MTGTEGHLKHLRVRFGFDSPLDRLMLEAAPSMRRSLLRSMAEDFIRFEAAGGVVPIEGAALPRGTGSHLKGKPFFVKLDINGKGTLNEYLRNEAEKGVKDLTHLVRQLAQRSLLIAARVAPSAPLTQVSPVSFPVPNSQTQVIVESAPTDQPMSYHEEFTDDSLGPNRSFGSLGGLNL